MAWNPDQYGLFREERSRPARDLIAALPAIEPKRVLDLGCGAGELARSLAERWPGAAVTGMDSSAAMLERAAATPSRVRWTLAEVGTWAPEEPPDLIVSNAALHWLPDHASLFPRLLGWLGEGGVLAVQMPRNYGAPSFQAVRAVASDPRWSGRLGSVLGPAPVHPPEQYYDWLAPLCRRLDIWETEYLQVLTGPAPVLEWLRGTTLVPIKQALSEDELQAFEEALRARLAEAYPQRRDGATLFPFRRLFLVART